MKSFQIDWKVYRQSKFSGQSGKFSNNHVICCSVFRQSGTIYEHLFMLWKQYTHFWHKCCRKNLRTLPAKFLCGKACRPESWDFLGLCHSCIHGYTHPIHFIAQLCYIHIPYILGEQSFNHLDAQEWRMEIHFKKWTLDRIVRTSKFQTGKAECTFGWVLT